MAKRKARSVPRIEVTRNKKKEFNYRIIGKNSKVLIHCNQGFKRIDRLKDNIKALVKIMNPSAQEIDITHVKFVDYQMKVTFWVDLPDTVSYFNIPIYQVN